MSTSAHGRRLRLGMVGGGATSMIGETHRMAARFHDRYALLAGALDAEPAAGRTFARELGIAADRVYDDFAAMAAAEAERDDGIDVVSILTPNNTHHRICRAFIDRGFHVICEKPLCTSLDDALDLVRAVRDAGIVFGLTHPYPGFPMVRRARDIVAAGELGKIWLVQAEFTPGWMSRPVEREGDAAAEWRTDPAIMGPSLVMADNGSHAHNLARFVTGLEVSEVAAELTTFVPGRRLEDNAMALLRFDNGARGMLWASTVTTGIVDGLQLRIHGEKAGLWWRLETSDQLTLYPDQEPARTLDREDTGLTAAGFVEGFANVYASVADDIHALRAGGSPGPRAYAGVEDGAIGIKFILAAIESSAAEGAWTDATLDL